MFLPSRARAELLLLMLCTALCAPARAQTPLPAWAESAWRALAAAEGLERVPRAMPDLRRADLDGDGRADLAVLARDKGSRKEGIVLLFANGDAPMVLGAGFDFGNGGDDFSWLGDWSVLPRGTPFQRPGEPDRRLDRDALQVERPRAASALIHLQDDTPRWLQLHD